MSMFIILLLVGISIPPALALGWLFESSMKSQEAHNAFMRESAQFRAQLDADIETHRQNRKN